MRVLLDTNVLLSALGLRSTACLDLLEHCEKEHVIVTTPAVLVELHRHLSGKFGFAPEKTRELLRLVLLFSTLVDPVPLPRDACRDPGDLPILGAALAGKCDCLVTGDKELLALKRYRGVPIIPPSGFWRFEASRM